MIKCATALRLGTAETEAILKRFTRNNLKHPTYLAFAELGKAIKTIFLCRLHSEALRREIQEGLKRRLRDAGLSTIYSNHSFRAAGITNYLENDGTLEVAQRIAGHADSRTTKLYDRRGQKVLLEDMERIRY